MGIQIGFDELFMAVLVVYVLPVFLVLCVIVSFIYVKTLKKNKKYYYLVPVLLFAGAVISSIYSLQIII